MVDGTFCFILLRSMETFFLVILPAGVLVGLTVYAMKKQRGRAGSQKTVTEEQKALYRKIADEIHRKSYFYHQLPSEEQQLFLQRVWLFYHVKRFEARGFDEVSFHMKVIISSYAAQITFGFDDIRLQHFRSIIVYPGAYFSTITERYHKGETHRDGAIVFSWSDLREGHNAPKNGINLALHEFAHALRLENLTPDEEYLFLSRYHLERFDELAALHIERMRRTPDLLLRNYAATNVQEFFSVCVENFFERPTSLQEHFPELYALLREVLRLDPLKRPMRLR